MTLKSLFSTTVLILLVPVMAFSASTTRTLSSPDGKIQVKIATVGNTSYSITYNGIKILDESEIGMRATNGTEFGADKKASRVLTGKVRNTLQAEVYKKSTVNESYNYLTLVYKNYNVEFRAYDQGVTYRFVSTAERGLFDIESEKAEFNFADDWQAWVPYVSTKGTFEQQFKSSFENYYEHIKLSDWDTQRLAFLPLTVDGPEGIKISITESDLCHYPGMYLNGQGTKDLKGVFAPYPAELKMHTGHNNLQNVVTKGEDYIAKVSAGHKFPWRIIAIVPEAKDLANIDLPWLVARPAIDDDWSWVKPGKVAWDWWNDWNLYGVDFRAGINNDTYKYYIDFASAHGIEYVILDEGWAVNKECDLLKVVPEIDLEELVAYADSKGVGLILWAGYAAVENDIDGILRHYSQMGIKGFKVDFMDRDDQQMVEFYEKVAALGAKYHLLIDFHGAYKPTGLNRSYPNVLNFEGVAGLEQLKWGKDDQVTYDCIIPFTRMVAGPMDYTQGAMRNATRRNYFAVNSEPMSQGTRCHQLAEYAIFDAPLTMLCDSPSNYMAEPECTEFIASFPTVWDETFAICGEIGEYVAVARRKGDTWYVGAMTNWTARDLTLDLSFTGGSKMTVFQDGINADRAARDYKKVQAELPADGRVKIHMAPGGGWVAKITD